MLEKISLEGSWKLQLDERKQGVRLPYEDSIMLPNTTSHARKGRKNEAVLLGSLTDEYEFSGYAWFSKDIEIPNHLKGKSCFLFLERTRVTTVWVDGQEIGTKNSLNTPHLYDLTDYLDADKSKHTLTIRVDNTDYPTKGGHLTSPDTQTNWNGITGRIELQFFGCAYFTDLQVYPNVADRSITMISSLVGDYQETTVSIVAESLGDEPHQVISEQTFTPYTRQITFDYQMGESARLWSDLHPNLYKLTIHLIDKDGDVLDTEELTIGLREFKAESDKFTINGDKTFLRGKHDGLIFPLTGYAPTEVEEWLRILSISKSYGINHYRFHTCCPPEAAFTAADMLGIYMQPELPFWGTITDETYDNHNQAEQDYLISEGFAMLKAFGNHPSFVMMSLGNELWGSKERLDTILKAYKAFDRRHLYVQGSNNFQFAPVILEHDDFFSGVRFSRDRLFRGSYAMCDAPLGHVQTDKPSTLKDYDEMIYPTALHADDSAAAAGQGTFQIQFGTEAKTVEAGEAEAELIPHIPVVSHEIGQYATFPNFEEIEKYTGSLKAKNFEVFRERLEAKGLGHLARKYFECSGKLAAACYKEELEAAFRSRKLAGFQLLDLQDFSGQGTALVGVLDAFMDSKGLITPEEWRSFCSDAVLLARFEKFIFQAGEPFHSQIELTYYRDTPLQGTKLNWELKGRHEQETYSKGEAGIHCGNGENYIPICEIQMTMPAVSSATQVTFSLSIEGTDIRKSYDLWIYPNEITPDLTGVHLFHELSDEAVSLLEKGEDILLLPNPESLPNSIEGLYSTDFWCYPMFRSISESMNKPVPVGTMGLLIDKEHPVFGDFLTEEYSTYPWWSIVSNSRSIILDDLPQNLQPLVQTIDNFERNHKLSLLLECRVLQGRVMLGTFDYDKIMLTPEGKQLMHSMVNYMKSGTWNPQVEISLEELQSLI